MRQALSTAWQSTQPAQATPPGWYPEPGKPGVLRYWNGASWEEWRQPLVAAPVIGQGQKSTAAAYVLAIFLGHLGAHNFYLGRVGPAVAMLLIWLLGVATSFIGIGWVLLAGVAVWWIVDLFCIPGYIRAANAKAVRPIV